MAKFVGGPLDGEHLDMPELPKRVKVTSPGGVSRRDYSVNSRPFVAQWGESDDPKTKDVDVTYELKGHEFRLVGSAAPAAPAHVPSPPAQPAAPQTPSAKPPVKVAMKATATGKPFVNPT